MVQDLLTGFVHAPWISGLDFSSLEKVSTSGVAPNLRRRESDVIWRIRWHGPGHSRFMYLLMEFQSRPDRFMALRLQAYVALLHQDLVRRGQLTADGKLPAVLPLVLYNGERQWNAATELADLIADAPCELRRYSPQLSYCLIDEMELPEDQIPGAGNLVGMLIRLERSRREDDILELAGQLERELRLPELSELRRQFAMWIHTVWASSRFPGMAVPAVTDLEEVWSMLAERVARWSREWERKGHTEGHQRGQAAIVLRLMARRFGPLSADVSARVERAAPEQLERWSDRLLDAATLEEVLESSD
jgi:hypothetical protein